MNKRYIIFIILFCLATCVIYGQDNLEEKFNKLDRLNLLETNMAKANIGNALQYAYLLYHKNTPESISKADKVLNMTLSFQVSNDSESGNYGLWPWSVGSTVKDKNVPLFHAHLMFVNLWDEQNKMSAQTREAFLKACKCILVAAERRYDEEIFELGREVVAYSNVFSLYVQTLTLAAERYDSDRLRRKANIQWRRFYNNFKFYGISEFLSTTYYQVIFDALMDIKNFGHEERIAKEAKEMMDFLYLQQSAVTHPLLKIPVSGIARDYREFTKYNDARVEFLQHDVQGYTPPTKAIEINTNRKYPFEATGRTGALPFVYKTYQTPNAAMGSMSGWGNYYWQQIYCMAAMGKSEKEKATLFIPGSYTPINGFTSQQGLSALCVFNRLPTMWHLTQWKGDLSDYRETFGEFGIGFTDQFKRVSRTSERIVIQAYGYDVYIFPFEMVNGEIKSSSMELRQREKTSPRYHTRPAHFNEYVFNEKADWFGVVVKIVESGQKVERPEIFYKTEAAIHTFSTEDNLSVSVACMEQGNCIQIRTDDVNLIPRLQIID